MYVCTGLLKLLHLFPICLAKHEEMKGGPMILDMTFPSFFKKIYINNILHQYIC